MPVPSSIADLSSTASSNYPSGSESIGTSLDDYLRAHASIIKQVSDAKADASHTQASTTISDSTAAGRTLLTAADAAAQRTALGLGTAATQPSSAFASSGSITTSGITQAAGKLLGRSTSGAGAVEEITLGSGVVLQAGSIFTTVLETAKATTSGSSVDFTGVPEWCNKITFMLSGVRTNGTSQRLIRIGSGSFDTTGYVGTCADLVTTGTVVASTSTVGIPITGTSATTASASCVLSGSITITRITGNEWVFSGSLAATGGVAAVCNLAGSKSLSGALDRIRITTVGGSNAFDSGSVNVIYE